MNMVLMSGVHRGSPLWKVNEEIPPAFARVYFVTSGTVKYEDLERQFPLRKGYLYIFPTTTAYSLSQDRKDQLHCTFLHYDIFPKMLQAPAVFPFRDDPFLAPYLSLLEQAVLSGTQPLITSLAEVLFIHLDKTDRLPFSTDILTPVLEYIGAHITSDLTVDRLSRLAGYNSQYFIRLFKDRLGVTPRQYIISYRIKEARKLLAAGESVTATAGKTGFSDIKAFSRCFRKRMSMSPTDYKNLTGTAP